MHAADSVAASEFQGGCHVCVGIHPRIDHIKLDEHTQKKNLSPKARIVPCLFSVYFSTLAFSSSSQARVYIHVQTS
jgi:hypothetical protein